MVRDFIMALLLLGLAAIPVISWMDGRSTVSVQKIEASVDR